MTKKMKTYGLNQSELDPYLCVEDKVICVGYVNNQLRWACNERDIAEACKQLQANGVNLNPEDDSAGFVGVCMHCNTESDTIK